MGKCICCNSKTKVNKKKWRVKEVFDDKVIIGTYYLSYNDKISIRHEYEQAAEDFVEQVCADDLAYPYVSGTIRATVFENHLTLSMVPMFSNINMYAIPRTSIGQVSFGRSAISTKMLSFCDTGEGYHWAVCMTKEIFEIAQDAIKSLCEDSEIGEKPGCWGRDTQYHIEKDDTKLSKREWVHITITNRQEAIRLMANLCCMVKI